MESRTNKTICLACFGELDSDRVCTSCKQKSDDTPAPPHHLPPRTVLKNRYLICKAIGEGGFGITYLAWKFLEGDTKGTKVAIKELFPNAYVYRMHRSNNLEIKDKANLVANSRSISRFMHEAKILASLKNTLGIVDVVDFFSANKTSYIVMEYLAGISLKNYHKQHGNISMDNLIDILLPIFDGLEFVHEKGLIHRDISPDNIIILDKNKFAKLVDFGASKSISITEQTSMSIVLKHGFAPEEQYRTNGEQGPWSDVYALACSMYYCMVGKLPPESIQRVSKDNIVPPSQMNAEISKSQEIVLMRALSVYSKNRYQSISEFKLALLAAKPIKLFPTKTIATSTSKDKNKDNNSESIKKSEPTKRNEQISNTSPITRTRHTSILSKMRSRNKK